MGKDEPNRSTGCNTNNFHKTSGTMTSQKKFLTASFLLFTIIMVLGLASGISKVEFNPGTISQQSATRTDTTNPMALEMVDLTLLIKVVLAIIFWVILPISILLFIRYPEVRKRFFQGMFYFLLYGFVILIFNSGGTKEEAVAEETGLNDVNLELIETQREAAEFLNAAATPTSLFNIILDILIVILLVGGLGFIYWRYIRKPSTTDQLREELEETIEKVKSGVDLRNVIIRCYADMSEILSKQRGIQRSDAMTPREFEEILLDLGFPEADVRQLTRLFESARYGHFEADETTEQTAIQCLTNIAVACDTL
jgi:hypothetical protein